MAGGGGRWRGLGRLVLGVSEKTQGSDSDGLDEAAVATATCGFTSGQWRCLLGHVL